LRAHVLVDTSPAHVHRAKYAERVRRATRILGGPRFALLAGPYVEARPWELRADVESIGVFMGGADAMNASELVLRACREVARFEGSIEVVTTSANAHLTQLRARCAGSGPTQLLVDLPDLVQFYQRHDLQIGAGGTASWERCRIGAPSVVLQCADNQAPIVEALTAAGAARVCRELTVQAIGRSVRELLEESAARRTLSERSRQLVDGRGAERVAVAMSAETVQLRDATEDDAAAAHLWRNDPRTLLHSRHTEPVSWHSHLAWWHSTLHDTRVRLLIACCGRRACGVLRLDIRDLQAEVSIYLDPELSGLGLGQSMLRAVQRWASTHASHIGQLVADVHLDNIASRRAFAGAGFLQRSDRSFVWKPSDTSLDTITP
jgi:UDP-2,4-diacetamido-2,4,6-trideoxy-beta-L-altropyranose hydrolase